MNKDNVFRSSNFHMGLGDVLHIIIDGESGVKPNIALYGASDDTTAEAEIVEDYDGNQYSVITIGSQQWLAENLKTTHYKDGTAITNLTLDAAWSADASGAYCWYNNDISNKDDYGALYNWYAINNVHGLAIEGWRIPTRADWATLISTLGGISIAAAYLKEFGTSHWSAPNAAILNTYGFNALPAGIRQPAGTFQFLTTVGYYSTSEALVGVSVYYEQMSYTLETVSELNVLTNAGLSIRCVRDI